MISVRQLRTRFDAMLDRAEHACPPQARRQELRAEWEAGAALWASAVQAAQARSIVPDLADPQPAIGEALSVVVLPEGGEARLVRVRVALAQSVYRTELPGPAGVSAETVDSMWRAVVAVAHAYPYHWAMDPRRDVVFDVTDLEGRPLALPEPVRGGSFAVATAVAAWSRLVGRAPAARVFTGALAMADDHGRVAVMPVGGVAAKHVEAHAAGLLLVAPVDSGGTGGEEWDQVKYLEDALKCAFGDKCLEQAQCRPPPHFDAGLALELLDVAYRRNGDGARWGTLAQRFAHLAKSEDLGGEQRVLAFARQGACWTHINVLAAAEPALREALALAEKVDPGRLDAGIEVQTRTHLGTVLRDLYRFTEAEAELKRAIFLGRTHRHTVPAVNAESTLGQVLVVSGQAEHGLELLARARDFYLERHSFEVSRNHTYVTAALGRLGRLEDARDEYSRGIRHNEAWAEAAQVRTNRAYLDLAWLDGRLRALRQGGASEDWPALLCDVDDAIQRSGSGGWPGLGLARVRDAATLRVRPGDLPEIICAARARRGDKPREGAAAILAWQSALVLAEAIHVAGNPSLLNEVEAWVPPGDAPRAWFAPHFRAARSAEDTPALCAAVDRLIAAEQY